MNCSVIRDDNGNIVEVLSQNGNKSNLYYDLLFELNDAEQALHEYALTMTESFNNTMSDAVLDDNGEHTIETYKNYSKDVKSEASNEIGFKLFKEVENWQFHGSYPAYDFMDDEIMEAASQATTRAQKKALQRVQNMHNQVIFEEGTHLYSVIINNEVVPLTSVSKVLQSDIRFKYEKQSDPNSKHLMWGNIADTILSGVITGKTKEEISNILAVKTDGMDVDYMTDAVKDKLYDEFKQFYEEQKAQGNLVLTQVRTFNSAQQVAGTLDILIIRPDGTTQVIDLKTSKNKFTGPESTYKTRFPSTSSDLSESERGLKILKASTYDKHSAQMSIYSAMLGSHNIKIAEEEKLRVFPITITAEDNLVTDIEREVPFIEAKKFQEFEDMYGGQSSLKDKDTFTKIIASLSNILSNYKREGRVDDAYQLEKFINDLQELDYGQAIITYINEVYEEIMGTNKSTGLKELLQASLSNLQDEDANVESILNNIVKIEQILNQYSPEGSVLESLKTEAIKSGAVVEKGSYLEKLFTVIDNIAVMRQSIQEELPSALAQYLVSSLPTGNDAIIKQEYIDLLEKQKKLIAKGKSDKAVQEEITKLEQQFGISKTNQDVNLAKVLEQEIRDGGYIDIGILDRWLESPMQLPVAYLSAFALKTKQEFEAARQEMIKFIPDLDASFKEFVKGKNLAGTKPKDLYKNFFEELTITVINEHGEKTSVTTSGFVNPIDYNRYETEKMEMYEEVSRMSIEEAARVKREWYARNSQPRPTQDVRDNNVVLIEGLESIYARKRRQFAKFGANAEKNFQLWKKDNTLRIKDENGNVQEILTGELAIPNTQIYINPKFTALQQNKQDYKYYLKLLGTYFESQSKQPQRSKFNYERYKFMLPNISKSELDRLTENGAKNLIQYKAKDLFQRIDDDLANENFSETANRSLNVLFFNKSKPMSAQDISYDLTSSIIRYKIAADRFEKQQKLATVGELLYNRVSKVETAQVSPSGIKKVKNYINAMTGAPAVATEKSNNAADLLLSFLETQIYNITRKDPIKKVGNKTFDIGKIVDTLISFGGVSTLGADITAAIANSLQANVMTMVEAGAKKFFSPSTVLWAQKTYLANEANFMSDSWESYPRSLLGQLIEIYDPMQGDYFNNIGRKIGKTALKQKGNIGKLLMSGMRKGEHRAAVTLMLSVLKETQVKQGDTTISLADAYELDKNGRIKLKEGVELNNELGLADADAQNKLHSISNRIFGIYNRESSVDALRYAIGRAALMFRKFLPQGIKYRFGSKQYNFQMTDFSKGMYRDFYKNLFTNTAEIKNMIFNPDETALTPTERENIQRAAVEHAFIMLTGLLVISLSYILEGEDDDDPEVQAGKWILYQTLRLNNELSTYGAAFNPATRGIPSLKPLTYSFSNVSAIFNVLSKATNLFQQVAEDIFTLSPAVYERDTGIWEKGDSKSLAALMKLLGINNRKIFREPDEAISTLILQRGASK